MLVPSCVPFTLWSSVLWHSGPPLLQPGTFCCPVLLSRRKCFLRHDSKTKLKQTQKDRYWDVQIQNEDRNNKQALRIKRFTVITCFSLLPSKEMGTVHHMLWQGGLAKSKMICDVSERFMAHWRLACLTCLAELCVKLIHSDYLW